jgi:hypothetical protein
MTSLTRPGPFGDPPQDVNVPSRVLLKMTTVPAGSAICYASDIWLNDEGAR